MEVTNLIDIHTREELYAWYLENHDKVSDFWLRVNRSREPYAEVVAYVDAVEVALCFGWIDSTMKRIDEGKPIQHFTPRRKGCTGAVITSNGVAGLLTLEICGLRVLLFYLTLTLQISSLSSGSSMP